MLVYTPIEKCLNMVKKALSGYATVYWSNRVSDYINTNHEGNIKYCSQFDTYVLVFPKHNLGSNTTV